MKREIQRLETCRVSPASVRHHKNGLVKALTLGRASLASHKQPNDKVTVHQVLPEYLF